MFNALLNDEAGAIVSAELVIIMTVTVIGCVVGLSEVAVAVNTELNDVSNAIGALNQSYGFSGFHATDCKVKSYAAGTGFQDQIDDCDKNQSCDIVCGVGVHCGEGGNGSGRTQ